MSRLIIGLRHRVSFEGQAAMELEYVVDPSIEEAYLFELEDGPPFIINWEPTLEGILADVDRCESETETNVCLAIPGKLVEISKDAHGVRMGKVNFGGIVKQVCLEYTPEADAGDYVLVHVGFALGKIDEEEAARTYKLLEDMEQLTELDVPDL